MWKGNLRNLFKNLLSNYALDPKIIPLAKEYYLKIYERINKSFLDSKRKIEMEMAEVKERINKLEERFIYGDIDRSLYEKHGIKLREQLLDVTKQMDDLKIQLSNAHEYVEYGIEKAANLSEMWHSTSTHDKISLQKLVFPDGIVYSREKGNYRTPRVHVLFEANPLINTDFDKNKKGLL